MKFSEAFSAMKSGAKVKLPSWAGYWDWDPEKETIRMHCRAEESDTGNEIMDIRESQRVEYTISNFFEGREMEYDKTRYTLDAGAPLSYNREEDVFYFRDTIVNHLETAEDYVITHDASHKLDYLRIGVDPITNAPLGCGKF